MLYKAMKEATEEHNIKLLDEGPYTQLNFALRNY